MLWGRHGDYHWVEWRSDSLHPDILTKFPDIVVGKYVTITADDAGPVSLLPEEIDNGWHKSGGLACSPCVAHVDEVARRHFVEWEELYVFNSPSVFDDYEVFVVYGGFSLQDYGRVIENLDPTWDKAWHAEWKEFQEQQQERFWQQLARIAPESYLANGDNLICVTRDRALFDRIVQSERP